MKIVRQTINDDCNVLGLSYKTCWESNIQLEKIGMHRIAEKYLLYLLMTEQKEHGVYIHRELKKKHCENDSNNNFIDHYCWWIMDLCYDPYTKQQSHW